MPYVITTRMSAGVMPTRPGLSRRDVATVEEARSAAMTRVWDVPGFRSRAEFSRVLDDAYRLDHGPVRKRTDRATGLGEVREAAEKFERTGLL